MFFFNYIKTVHITYDADIKFPIQYATPRECVGSGVMSWRVKLLLLQINLYTINYSY